MNRNKKWSKKLLSAAIAGTMIIGNSTTTFAWTTSNEVSEREEKNAELAVEAAQEGMVLLKNNGALPVNAGSKIALYGSGAVCTIKGGTGSGDVNQRNVVNIYDGLKDVYNIANQSYLQPYIDDWAKAQAGELTEGTEYINAQQQFFNTVYTGNETHITDAQTLSQQDIDCAFYVISRVSGEGSDRAAAENDGDYNLSEIERENLETLTKFYDKVVVLLNTANVIDTKFIEEIPGIDAVLLISQGGMYSGTAVADVLTGEVSPSGKLVDTWPVDFMDFPSSATLGENYDAENSREQYDEFYYDDIYVGYRYFDTFNVKPAYEFGYGMSYTTFETEPVSVTADAQNVTVEVKVTNTGDTYSGKEVVQVYFSAPDGELEKPYQELIAYAKTDVLAPGQSQTLSVTFKTDEMSSYSEDKAAYIMEDGDYIIRVGNSSRNTKVAAVLTLDADTITEQLSNQLVIQEDKVEQFEAGKLSNEGVTPYSYDTEAAEIEAAKQIALTSTDFVTVNNASAMDDESVITYYSENDANTDSAKYFAKGGWNTDKVEEKFEAVTTDKEFTLLDVYNGTCTMEQFVAGLNIEELSYIVNGIEADNIYGVDYARANELSDMTWEEGEDTVEAGSALGYLANYVQGTVWASTGRYYNTQLIPSVSLPDGPAGIRITKEGVTTLYDVVSDVVVAEDGSEIEKEAEIDVLEDAQFYQYCTAWPVGCMLAQTWNTELLERVGTAYGEELSEMGATYLLGPGMNIHRTPLCGRNFEYYSEDPTLTGYTALSFTQGVQSNDGVGVTLKHFAANNNENGRNYVNDVVSERALREIYLKGFEIAVKGAAPMAMMTSYNKINGEYAVNNYDLCTDICKGEWGFDGLIMSDYGAANRAEPNEELDLNMWANIMHAGNDWIMGGSSNSVVAETDEEGNIVQDASFTAQINVAEEPSMGLGDLQDSAITILNGIIKSNKFGDNMANYVDTSIVAPQDVAELQKIHNGSYTKAFEDKLISYINIEKEEVK